MEKKSCVNQEVVVSLMELPLSCPRSDERLWDGHPRVYLDIQKTGSVDCPYCETRYVLS